MADEPLYDPDRHVPEDLDFTDPAVARAYINHPTTEKLTEDLGREFRQMPAAEQLRELGEFLVHLTEQRDRVVVLLQGDHPDAACRETFEELLASIDKHIEGTKLRMLELG